MEVHKFHNTEILVWYYSINVRDANIAQTSLYETKIYTANLSVRYNSSSKEQHICDEHEKHKDAKYNECTAHVLTWNKCNCMKSKTCKYTLTCIISCMAADARHCSCTPAQDKSPRAWLKYYSIYIYINWSTSKKNNKRIVARRREMSKCEWHVVTTKAYINMCLKLSQ